MSEHADNHEVRVHIDQHEFRSPNPTTGTALYALVHVPGDKVLFREVRGNREDKPVRRDDTVIRLQQDDHFHSGALEFMIFVNTRPKTVTQKVLTFDEVTQLAYPGPHDENTFFTVSYRKAAHDKHGTLTVGQSVEIKEGTIFDVTKGDKS